MSGIHRVHVADERDPWLKLGLGIRATLSRFEALLATHAPEVGSQPVEAELDDATALVLGAIALAERLAKQLHAIPDDRHTPDSELVRAEWFR